MAAREDRIRLVLGQVWPDGPPAEERALLESLPIDRADLVLRRLKSILAVEGGAPIGEAAHELGVDRPAFFRLRKAWSANRSLRAIAPFADRAPRRLGASLADAELVDAVIRESDPNASASSMAAEVVRRSGKISPDAALGMVRVIRMRLSADPDYLRDRFGRVLMVDACAVSLAARDDDRVSPMIVAVVFDRASRLIIGHASGLRSDPLPAQVAAISATSHVGGDVNGTGSSTLEVVVGYGPPGEVDNFSSAFKLAGADVVDRGSRRCGSRMLSLIGHRLHRLQLRPRITNPDEPWSPDRAAMSFEPMAPANASALIDEAVRGHNRMRLLDLSGNGNPADMREGVVARYLNEIETRTSSNTGTDCLRYGCAKLRSVLDQRG